jgi:DNA repair protein RadC
MPHDFRILEQGPEALTDIELLSALLPRSSRRFGPEEIAARVLSMGLAALRRASAGNLVSIDGVRERDAARVLAALELGRRVAQAGAPRPNASSRQATSRRFSLPGSRTSPTRSSGGAAHFALEEVRSVPIARGGLTQCSVLPREAFAPAVLHRVPRVAFAHNHPSGDPQPSADDVRLGAALDDAGRALGIEVVDHLVIADGAFHSARHGSGHLTSPLAAA